MSADQEPIDVFFRNPLEVPESSGTFGVLYLLRRDINVCFDKKIATWPATMAILAGIDLLGRFHEVEDTSSVGKRFRGFVKKYFDISRDGAETIYQLRNALMHSFGLYSKGCRFSLINTETDSLIQRSLDGKYVRINIRALKKEFEAAIERYQADVRANSELQKKFEKMYSDYGAINIS